MSSARSAAPCGSRPRRCRSRKSHGTAPAATCAAEAEAEAEAAGAAGAAAAEGGGEGSVAAATTTVRHYSTLERPKLLFADPTDPLRPTHLLNGASPVWDAAAANPCGRCQAADGSAAGQCVRCKVTAGADWTYTVVRPLAGGAGAVQLAGMAGGAAGEARQRQFTHTRTVDAALVADVLAFGAAAVGGGSRRP